MLSWIFICSLAICAQAEPLLTLPDFLKRELKDFKKTSKETFELSDSQLKELKDLARHAQEKTFTLYFGKDDAGKLQKTCLVVPQEGKEGPMQVGVCFDALGLVSQIDFLEFNEDRGKKVREEAFLRQFHGKSAHKDMVIGSGIDGVSGATWSSEAVAEALRKSSFVHEKFVRGKK